jgi:hypothetical protein
MTAVMLRLYKTVQEHSTFVGVSTEFHKVSIHTILYFTNPAVQYQYRIIILASFNRGLV